MIDTDAYVKQTLSQAAEAAIKIIEAAKPQFLEAVDAAIAAQAEKTKHLNEIYAWPADNLYQAAIRRDAYNKEYERVFGAK